VSGAEVEWLSSPDNGVRLGRTGEGPVVEWAGIGRLVVSRSGEHTFRPGTDVDAEALRKFRATDLLACQRYLGGHPSLHGSAVAWACGAVALVGESGAGKSTTAMALVERTGAAFIADDIVPLEASDEQIVIGPVDDCFWLEADACAWFGVAGASSRKTPVVPRVREQGPSLLRSIVQLVFDEGAREPELTRITGQEAFVVLSRSQVSFSFGLADAVVRDLEDRSRLAASISILRLRRRRSMDALDAVANLLANSASAGPAKESLR